MPSMKKKTNYESKGFVRRLMKGASFKSLGSGESLNDDSFASTSFRRFGNIEGSKWRPRKNQFERLDCDDDDDSLSAAFNYDNPSSWNIENAISSTESEVGEYRRGIMFEQKATALKKTPIKNKNDARKRELSPIKPPCKDTSAIRAPTSSTKKIPKKKQKQDMEWGVSSGQNNFELSDDIVPTRNDPFLAKETDSFGFEIHPNRNSGKNPSTISSHIEKSTKIHRNNPHSSYNTVTSDPTDFFSKEQSTKLTMKNLAKMESFNTKTSSKANTRSVSKGMEKLVRERKFYQFAVDEDKASTVVESTLRLPADYPGGDYSIDDDTEISCDETSQGTRIQQRSVTSDSLSQKNDLKTKDLDFFSNDSKNVASKVGKDILPAPSYPRKHAREVDEFEAFFPSDATDTEKRNDKERNEFFPSGVTRDGFFPDFGGTKENQQAPPPPETDISSFGADNYFDLKSTNGFGDRSQQASTKSLSYSVSPIHKKKAQNGRQPLTLKNSQPGSGKKTKTFPNNNVHKSDQDNQWFTGEGLREREALFQFDDGFAARPIASKKRHSSISSNNFQPPPADPFAPNPNQASAKENFTVKSNRNERLDDDWNMNQNKQYQRNIQSNERPIQRNLTDSDSDGVGDDDDSFEEIGQWEKQVPASMLRSVHAPQNTTTGINRARLHRRDNASYNRPSRNKYIDDYEEDDARSTSGFSVGKVSRASTGSRKPLALPSNAIMASMLFQTQHDIDQNDVEEKINAIEQENFRHKKDRNSRGGIPDAVNADEDYMTTISSFSEGTSAYLQDTWRKPSRDLLNHFTSARALDMEYRRLPIRTTKLEQKQGLFEA